MIVVTVKKKDDKIHYIRIEGHANYAEEGYDIVCASVSSIAITTVNALISIDEDSVLYSESDGFLEIGIMKHDRVNDILVNNMLDLLSKLAQDYEEYVKIIR